MTNPTPPRFRRGLAIACAAGALTSVAPRAGANVYGTYIGPTNYTWWVTALVDFDQVREVRPANVPFPGLPAGGGLANDGKMYCVPTATMNLFAYCASHGYPGLQPGAGSYADWQTMVYADPYYEAATFALAFLGSKMSTSPTGGTNNAGWYDGASFWVQNQNIDVGSFVTSNNWAPLARHMGQITHNTGGLVALCYGRYTWANGGGPNGEDELISRESGHCVSLQRIEVGASSSATIWIRNPSSGSSESTWLQSQFTSSELATTDHTYFIVGKGLREMSRLGPVDTQLRLLNSVYMVMPQQGLVQKSIQFNANTIGGFAGPSLQNASAQFNPPSGLSWEQVEWCPMRTHFVGLASGVNPTTGRVEKFVTGLHPGTGASTPTGSPVQANTSQILYGTDMNLWVLAPTGVQAWRPDADFNYDMAHNFPAPAGFSPKAMCFDEDDFQVCLLDPATGSLMVYPPYAGMTGDDSPVPGIIDPPVAFVGTPIMQWAPDPSGAHEFIIGDTGSDLMRLYSRCSASLFCQVGSFRLPGGLHPKSISPTSTGEFYIATDTGVICMEDLSGVWTRNPNAPWDGTQADRFIVSRNRTNFDPTVEPPYTNILPEDLYDWGERVDCGYADVTTTNTNPGDAGYGTPDGTVDGADLAFYVEQWLAQSALADMTTTNTNPGDPLYGLADGTVDGADLSFYVEAWLNGCPVVR